MPKVLIPLGKIEFGSQQRKWVKPITLIPDQQTSTIEVSEKDYESFSTIGTFDMTKPIKGR